MKNANIYRNEYNSVVRSLSRIGSSAARAALPSLEEAKDAETVHLTLDQKRDRGESFYTHLSP